MSKIRQIFKVIEAINQEGIDNSQWHVVNAANDVVNTRTYFGTKKELLITGHMIAVYKALDESFSFLNVDDADTELEVKDDENIRLYLWWYN